MGDREDQGRRGSGVVGQGLERDPHDAVDVVVEAASGLLGLAGDVRHKGACGASQAPQPGNDEPLLLPGEGGVGPSTLWQSFLGHGAAFPHRWLGHKGLR